MTQQYPALVYGTLRPGCGNYFNLLEGNTISEEDVRIDGYTMYGRTSFPYLTFGDSTVTATLIHINPDRYHTVLQSLDWLEGYSHENSPSNHYDRKLVEIMHDGELIKAWIYIAAPRVAEDVRNNLPVIENGDWVEHIRIARETAYTAF